MFDRRLRPHLTRWLEPIARPLARHASATTITLFAGLAGLGAAVSAAASLWLVSLGCWLLNRLLDALDGSVARNRSATSDQGGYLDMVTDVSVYAALTLGIGAGMGVTDVWVGVAVLLASFYVNTITWTYLAAILEKRAAGATSLKETTTITMPPGWVEGFETLVAFSLILILAAAKPDLVRPALWVFASLVALGAYDRARRAYRRLGA